MVDNWVNREGPPKSLLSSVLGVSISLPSLDSSPFTESDRSGISFKPSVRTEGAPSSNGSSLPSLLVSQRISKPGRRGCEEGQPLKLGDELWFLDLIREDGIRRGV